MSYLQRHQKETTPQSEKLRDDQVANTAGGQVWSVGPFQRLRRWLVLGSEGGSYYANERKLTKQNTSSVKECLRENPAETILTIVEVSEGGLAPRNDQAIYALAMAAADEQPSTRALALSMLPRVCRTGTHLLMFVDFINEMRGWGPQLRKAVGAWYTDKKPDDLAYQLVKYRQRGGWTHADVLRLANPRGDDHPEINPILRWTVGKEVETELPRVIRGYQHASNPDTFGEETTEIIRAYGLDREMVPTESLSDPNVWEALLDKGMPMTALIRNLANMTRIGLLTPNSDATKTVTDQLADEERVHKARVHPFNVLNALATYASGHGFRGSNTWTPVGQIIDALDAAFYTAFGNVESTDKRVMLALDVSGSMTAPIYNSALSCREGAAAMALVTAAAESRYEVVGFYAGDMSEGGWASTQSKSRWGGRGDGITPLPITPRQRLDDVVRLTNHLRFGGTDCALPMLYAAAHDKEIDTFVIYTDSETWFGSMHPTEALRRYRKESGIDSRLVVVSMVANDFTIADPADAGMLDVVGFDSSAPTIISDFGAGRI